ncbi:hypothetical protein [Chryseobacterium sp. G0201]|uniref:hypothetical protein n=1 Tax=Chryseobacterium sp. G0201 TaxID=2487065 RepID=UPI000F4E6E10|nr:hypothetical protein [Chryseobacterium sp. G0201]
MWKICIVVGVVVNVDLWVKWVRVSVLALSTNPHSLAAMIPSNTFALYFYRSNYENVPPKNIVTL